MHYCLLLITKDAPTREVISKVMWPYCESNPARQNYELDDKFYLFEYEHFYIGGRFSGQLQFRDGTTANSGLISELANLDALNCYICIDKDGNAISREDVFGIDPDEVFQTNLAKIKSKSSDCFATILDIQT